MSIYVSICCLGVDKELVNTIESCISSAEYPENINIGIAFIGRNNFFEETKEKLKKYKNIRYTYVELQNNWGVGNGRLLATSMYNNEDYFLQVDAHTRFADHWDTYLIDRLHKAQILVNNEKVVLSGLPGFYAYENHEDDNAYPIKTSGPLKYPKWVPGEYMSEEHVMPRWWVSTVHELSPQLGEMVDKTGFAPLPKISAAFIFSNKHFANNTCMDKKYIVFEEEMIQSSELVSNGFTLVYPGEHCVVFHLYKDDIKNNKGFRESLYYPQTENIIKDDNEILTLCMKNYVQYYKYPKTRPNALKFEKYNNIDFLHGAINENVFPKEYANIGYMAIGEK